MKRILVICGVLLATGCFGPRADSSTFFLLTPAPANAPTPLPLRVGLGPVTLPGYLDRPQLVRRVSDNQVTVSETEHWAEPLRDNVWRTLAEDLTRRVQPRAIVAYPWHPSADVDFAVSVDIARFEADTTGAARLDASWRIEDRRSDSVVQHASASFEERAAGPGTEAAVAALSRALAQLGDTLARGLRAAHGADGGGR